jgi:Type II secretion system protein C
MLRLSAYLLALTIAAVLMRDAATWAWIAYTSPLVLPEGESSTPAVADKPGGQPAETRLAEIDQRPLAAFPQTASRPVFFEGRRYPAKEAAKKTVQEPEQQQRVPTVSAKELKLLGVRVEQGASQALIANGAQPPAWFNVGEKIMNWTVASVEPNDVLLKRDGQTADLKLYEP